MSIFELPTELKQKSIKPAGRASAPKIKTVVQAPPVTKAAANPQPTKKAEPSPQELEQMAMEAMADLSAKFPAWASGDVQTMKQLIGEASGVFDDDRTSLIRQKLYPKAHDLKGQGATFGYPLITDIGTHMCRLITEKSSYNAADLNALKEDALMMETVLWKKLKGDGGKRGLEILRKLAL